MSIIRESFPLLKNIVPQFYFNLCIWIMMPIRVFKAPGCLFPQLKLPLFPTPTGVVPTTQFSRRMRWKRPRLSEEKPLSWKPWLSLIMGGRVPLFLWHVCYCSLFLVVKSQLSWLNQVSFKDSNSRSFAKWISASVKRRQCHFLELVDLWFTLWSICDLNVLFFFPWLIQHRPPTLPPSCFLGGLRFFFFRSDSQVACCPPKMHQIWSRPYPKRSILWAR